GELFAMTSEGKAIWQDEAGLPTGVLQSDLSATAPLGLAVQLPDPATSMYAFRLGNGEVCVERVLNATSPACDATPLVWTVQCLDGAGDLRTIDLTTLSPDKRGEQGASLGLQEGWVTAGYPLIDPGCTPS